MTKTQFQQTIITSPDTRDIKKALKQVKATTFARWWKALPEQTVFSWSEVSQQLQQLLQHGNQ